MTVGWPVGERRTSARVPGTDKLLGWSAANLVSASSSPASRSWPWWRARAGRSLDSAAPAATAGGPRSRSTRSRSWPRTTATTSSPSRRCSRRCAPLLGAAADAFEYTHRPLADELDAGVRQVELDVFVDDPAGGRYAQPKLRAAARPRSRRPRARRSRPQGPPRAGGRLPLDLPHVRRLPGRHPGLVRRPSRPPADHDPDRGQGRRHPRPGRPRLRAAVALDGSALRRPRGRDPLGLRQRRHHQPRGRQGPFPQSGRGRAQGPLAHPGRGPGPGHVRARRQGRQA